MLEFKERWREPSNPRSGEALTQVIVPLGTGTRRQKSGFELQVVHVRPGAPSPAFLTPVGRPPNVTLPSGSHTLTGRVAAKLARCRAAARCPITARAVLRREKKRGERRLPPVFLGFKSQK
jgi:hypothetical protein